jgi:hypothetical protein
VTEPPTFSRTYASLVAEATDSTGSETHGDGWYEVTFYRGDTRVSAVDFVVQSMKIVHRRTRHTYTIKFDRLGGFNLTIELLPGAEIPEDEYRTVFRGMFSDVGLPPSVIDELTFEYTPTVW